MRLIITGGLNRKYVGHRVVLPISAHIGWMRFKLLPVLKSLKFVPILLTILPVRKKSKAQVETFSVNKNTDYEEKQVQTEDYGAVLFKMTNGVHGVFHVSEMSAGRKCYFNFEIDGSKASLYWNQETADWMWMGYRDQDNHQVMRNPNLMAPEARPYTYLAAGHPEGWNDAMRNNVYSFYKYIAEGKQQGVKIHLILLISKKDTIFLN